jgi:ketosteroid isomerase-like protein
MDRAPSARLLLAIAAIAVTSLVSAQPARAESPDFKSVMSNVIAAWETLDPAKAAAHYTKEKKAVFFDITLPLKYVGWDAYAAGTKETFAMFSSIDMTMHDDVWIDARDDFAVTAATGSANLVMKDGGTMAAEWRWTVAWRKQDGKWLIAHEHLSAPMPPLPMAEPAAK